MAKGYWLDSNTKKTQSTIAFMENATKRIVKEANGFYAMEENKEVFFNRIGSTKSLTKAISWLNS